MSNKIDVRYIGLSEKEVKDSVEILLARYQVEVEVKEMSPRSKDSTHQGVIMGIIIELVVEPFVKSAVEFVSKEFCSAVKEMVLRWRKKNEGATAMILLKKDEADGGIPINPEANEEYFEELWCEYVEEVKG
jgi:hypothetical protein